MQKPTKLAEVRNDRKRAAAKELRGGMFSALREISASCGDDISGYAIVAWEKDGSNHSMYRAGMPIPSRLIPTFAGDALTQHVAIDVARSTR